MNQNNTEEDDSVTALVSAAGPAWAEDAEQELRKIPFFVRGKARRNTETFRT